MLCITIDADGASKLSFAKYKRLALPDPEDGADEEENGDLILKFENEIGALRYSDMLENLSLEIKDKSSARNLAISDIIMSTRNDAFVQTYLRQIE